MKKKIRIELNLDFDGTQEEYENLMSVLDLHPNNVILGDFPEVTVSNMKIKETDDRKILKTSTTGTTGAYSYRT